MHRDQGRRVPGVHRRVRQPLRRQSVPGCTRCPRPTRLQPAHFKNHQARPMPRRPRSVPAPAEDRPRCPPTVRIRCTDRQPPRGHHHEHRHATGRPHRHGRHGHGDHRRTRGGSRRDSPIDRFDTGVGAAAEAPSRSSSTAMATNVALGARRSRRCSEGLWWGAKAPDGPAQVSRRPRRVDGRPSAGLAPGRRTDQLGLIGVGAQSCTSIGRSSSVVPSGSDTAGGGDHSGQCGEVCGAEDVVVPPAPSDASFAWIDPNENANDYAALWASDADDR